MAVKQILIVFAVVFSLPAIGAQKKNLPSESELEGITARGRVLAEYDFAAWHATDAVQATHPPEGSVERYIARKLETGWVVVFGRFNEKHDAFLVAYEATQGASPQEFAVKKYDPPREDTSFYLSAAKGIGIALQDFRGENRPYNVAVLPADSGQMYVYVLPAQTTEGVYPLGGDARYLVSPDGSAIMEKRQMHKSILEFKASDPTVKMEGGFHTHVLSDVPEDSDVFYVLTRKPSIPEYIGTKDKRIYIVQVDGEIVLTPK